MKIDSLYYNAGPDSMQQDATSGSTITPAVRLKFEYDETGRLTRMYYMESEHGNAAAAATVEYYWSGNLPYRIIRTDVRMPGQEFVLELTYGLRPVHFDPWALLSRFQLTNAHTEIWNLPFLASIDRLPLAVRITRLKNREVCETSLLAFRQETDDYNRLTSLTIGQSDTITLSYP